MPYRKTARVEERLADRRARILRAARTVVAEGGFRAAQMDTVAAAAEIAVGTVYRYFPSKADLFAEVVSNVARREVDVLAGIAISDGSASRKLGDAVKTFTSRAMRGRRLAYAMIAEPADPEVDAVRLKYHRAIARVFQTIIAEGVRRREFRPQDGRASAACIVGAMMHGLVGPLAQDAAGASRRAPALVSEIAEFCTRAVARRRGAA